jgi:hypothetical protein
MARGNIAKDLVEKKIITAFGADYVGTADKKIYVQALENGEKVQIAISLTCPKVPITVDNTVQIGDYNFEDSTPTVVTTSAAGGFTPAEISDEERANVAALMARLGL